VVLQSKTSDFAQVIDAFSSGVEAFKQMQNQYGLNESSIDDTVGQIQEVCILAVLVQQFRLMFTVSSIHLLLVQLFCVRKVVAHRRKPGYNSLTLNVEYTVLLLL